MLAWFSGVCFAVICSVLNDREVKINRKAMGWCKSSLPEMCPYLKSES